MAKKEMGPKERQLREMREARQAQAAATAASKKATKKPPAVSELRAAVERAQDAPKPKARRSRKESESLKESLEAPASEPVVEPTPVAPTPDWQTTGEQKDKPKKEKDK